MISELLTSAKRQHFPNKRVSLRRYQSFRGRYRLRFPSERVGGLEPLIGGGGLVASVAAGSRGSIRVGFGCKCRGHAHFLFTPFWHLWARRHVSTCLCEAKRNDQSGR